MSTEIGGASRWLTPVRQLVQDPSGGIWWLGADGRVARAVTLDEVGSWASYQSHPPITLDGVLTFQPPDTYTGPAWEMRNRTWAQMVKLAACTCGETDEGAHWAWCCLLVTTVGASG